MCNHEQYDQLVEVEKWDCDEMFYKKPEDLVNAHNTTMEVAEGILAYNFKTKRSDQIVWMKRQIKSADDDDNIMFILIVGHHALFSQGPHKIPKIFNENIQPILRSSNKIIGWFCGHDHALEHYIWDKQKHAEDNGEYNNMHQFLSGAGGRDTHPMASPAVESQVDDVKLGYLGKTFGFATVHVHNAMTVRFWNQWGKKIYQYTLDFPK